MHRPPKGNVAIALVVAAASLMGVGVFVQGRVCASANATLSREINAVEGLYSTETVMWNLVRTPASPPPPPPPPGDRSPSQAIWAQTNLQSGMGIRQYSGSLNSTDDGNKICVTADLNSKSPDYRTCVVRSP